MPTGLQLFSAYRQGILDPEIVSTQAVSSKKSDGPSTSNVPRIPATWLKPRGGLSRLVAGHVPTITSTRQTLTNPAATAQKVPYDPQASPSKMA